ncbi:MAG: 3-keto-5-aminohexanoate cleavage protein [Desulfobacteraceae bacterium]|nr:3-keto-5-aminohexanoate cleavage protein [Desulfobacteraceae bacterium]
MSEEKTLRKVIITAAITGAGPTPTMSPYLPVTPQQIVEDAVKAYEAGAAIAHVHARNPENGEPSADLNLFREIGTEIKRRTEDMIICITTGGAGNKDERIAVVPEFKPELATLNCGALSGTMEHMYPKIKDKLKYDWEHEHIARDYFIFENTFEMMKKFSLTDRENNTKPEIEIWDSGQISNVAWLLEHEYLDRPLHLQYVMGALSGMPAAPETLSFIHELTRKNLGDFTWSVAAVGKDQLRMAAVTLVMGGHVRVGMEDSLFCGYGRLARSSAEQVERVVKMAEQLSIEPATPSEAREIIGLKGVDQVNF